MDESKSLHTFDELVRQVIGMQISRAWNGYGSAICLDLGELREEIVRSRSHLHGEAFILVQWDWRAEFQNEVVAGSSSSRKLIKRFLQRLKNERISSVVLDDVGPELRVHISNGIVIRTMVMHRADPQWSVRLPSGQTFHVINGIMTDQPLKQGMTAVEQAECDLSKSASQRWKSEKDAVAQDAEQCARCCFHIGLDASFHFHDFGVCVCASSPYDGRVTATRWTCPCFTPKDFDDETTPEQ